MHHRHHFIIIFAQIAAFYGTPVVLRDHFHEQDSARRSLGKKCFMTVSNSVCFPKLSVTANSTVVFMLCNI